MRVSNCASFLLYVYAYLIYAHIFRERCWPVNWNTASSLCRSNAGKYTSMHGTAISTDTDLPSRNHRHAHAHIWRSNQLLTHREHTHTHTACRHIIRRARSVYARDLLPTAQNRATISSLGHNSIVIFELRDSHTHTHKLNTRARELSAHDLGHNIHAYISRFDSPSSPTLRHSPTCA